VRGVRIRNRRALLALLRAAEGRFLPGQEAIAATMGITSWSVRRHLNDFRREGLVRLSVVNRGGGVPGNKSMLVQWVKQEDTT
jgi:biotin operon repressor